jgi:hypothetical protein
MSEKYSFEKREVRRIARSVRDGENTRDPNYINQHRKPAPIQAFNAIIVSAGPDTAPDPSDYSDNRYWFKRAFISNSVDEADAFTVIEPLADDHPLFVHATATNFSETDSHGVPADIPVLIYYDYDLTTDPRSQPRFFFWYGGGGSSIPLPDLQGQVLQATSQNVYGWQFPVLHAMD